MLPTLLSTRVLVKFGGEFFTETVLVRKSNAQSQTKKFPKNLVKTSFMHY